VVRAPCLHRHRKWNDQLSCSCKRKRSAMSWTKIGVLIFIVAMAAVGQVLFKIAAQSMNESITLKDALRFAFNPYLLTSLTIYGLLIVLWILLLRDTPLNQQYLVTALSLVLVPLAGTFFFQEPFSWRLLLGLVIILLGLAVALW
jgi:drug/metabolite transporter (DMT)-like permease